MTRKQRMDLIAAIADVRTRDADVRTLDEWAEQGLRSWIVSSRMTGISGISRCALVIYGDTHSEDFSGNTLGEARAKAAAWVRAQEEAT